MLDEFKTQDRIKLEQCPTPDMDLNPLDLASDDETSSVCPSASTPIPQEVLDACCDVIGAKNEVSLFDLTEYFQKQKILMSGKIVDAQKLF